MSDFDDSPDTEEAPNHDDRSVAVRMELEKAKTAREASLVLLKYGLVTIGNRKPGSGLTICPTGC